MTTSLFTVKYVNVCRLKNLLAARQGGALGVVGYGGSRPEFLPQGCPFTAASLEPVGEDAVFEIWLSPSPPRYQRLGRIAAAFTEDVVFGLLELEEPPGQTLENPTRKAYLEILDFLETSGYPAPLRFWNYLPGITADQQEIERYRRFNIGRHDAFSAGLKLSRPPVASAIGGRDGPLLIYFLAAREEAEMIENPRQVSAYDYPVLYGPRSPRFSRASIHRNGNYSGLLISGTASIVGHESLHLDDPDGQIAETFNNLEAVIGQAWHCGFPVESRPWALKIYLRDPEFKALVSPRIEATFGSDCDPLYLKADLCRSELLLEIEAACLPDRTVAGSRSRPIGSIR